ncbi:MAG: DUF1385 domain-containing protein [Candidatus Nealsonbacteria bacterium]|nr:DUF1385 domain-containing protein [Candidatus Nealsonbacteria bacterium]
MIIDSRNKIWVRLINGEISSGITTSRERLQKIQNNASLFEDPTFIVLLLLLWVFVLMPRLSLLEGLTGIMALSLLLFYDFLPVLQIVLGNKNLKQWHSCEHKLILLLEGGERITNVGLKTISPIHPRGKTTIVIGVWPIRFYLSIQEGKSCFLEPTERQLELTVKVGEEYLKRLSLVKGLNPFLF